MKWNKANKERLFHLLKKANKNKISGLGIIAERKFPTAGEDRDYVVIPDPRHSDIKRSHWIRAYLCQGPHATSRPSVRIIDSIVKQIKEECFIDVPIPLVVMVMHDEYYNKDRKVDPEWRKIDLLKIPKDVAEKFLVLGVP